MKTLFSEWPSLCFFPGWKPQSKGRNLWSKTFATTALRADGVISHVKVLHLWKPHKQPSFWATISAKTFFSYPKDNMIWADGTLQPGRRPDSTHSPERGLDVCFAPEAFLLHFIIILLRLSGLLLFTCLIDLLIEVKLRLIRCRTITLQKVDHLYNNPVEEKTAGNLRQPTDGNHLQSQNFEKSQLKVRRSPLSSKFTKRM